MASYAIDMTIYDMSLITVIKSKGFVGSIRGILPTRVNFTHLAVSQIVPALHLPRS